jgi:D-alanine transaminase
MPRIAYVNGRYTLHSQAAVHVEDRGYQFADGIYEVWAVRQGKVIDADGHFERLKRSLGELQISAPVSMPVLKMILRRIVTMNRLRDGLVYLQITRGVARRDHAFPTPEVKPAIVITAKAMDPRVQEAKAVKGVAVITVPDNRWGRCDIKTIGLLPNVLAKQKAVEQGATEAWFVHSDGQVSEGSSTNAWIVDAQGVLRTRDASDNILRGITRTTLIKVIERLGIPFETRAFTVEEAKLAREAFITSATAWVTPVVEIDGQIIANGEPGLVSAQLRAVYLEEACKSSI